VEDRHTSQAEGGDEGEGGKAEEWILAGFHGRMGIFRAFLGFSEAGRELQRVMLRVSGSAYNPPSLILLGDAGRGNKIRRAARWDF
jgi:hypothetical protein